jgi:hypothetical protein
MTMPRSEDELAQALAQSEAWMDAVNPDEVPADAVDDRKDLRQIGAALIAIEAAEQALVSAVANARANKRSWTDIANILGVSRQAARQRFDDRVAESYPEASVRLWIGTPSLIEPSFEPGRCLALLAFLSSDSRLSTISKCRRELYEALGLSHEGESDQLADLVKAAQEEHRRG